MNFGNFAGAASTNEMDPMCAGFKLSRTQRLYGFGICLAVGMLISILVFFIALERSSLQSTIFLTFGKIEGFAVLYTFGNIVSLLGTGFLGI